MIGSLHKPAGQDTPTGRARLAREAAAYISSYLPTGKGSKRKLGESVRSDQLPRSVIHVSTRLPMQTGVTIRALRFRRLAHCRWRVELPFPEQRLVQDLVAAFPGYELERGPPTGEAGEEDNVLRATTARAVRPVWILREGRYGLCLGPVGPGPIPEHWPDYVRPSKDAA